MRPVSAAGLRELSQYRVAALATDDNLVQLESCVERATDEKPIQEYLEAHPQVLASLLAGSDRYCIPKARLGGRYVPDFLLCYADSVGAHWFLVELETPRSRIALATGRDFEQHAREGVAQVQEWRRWLENNLATARASIRDDGLGLVGISPNARGIVLVGRREFVNNNHDRLRRTVEAQQRIEIHTYDWLVEQLRQAATAQGPRGMNPALLREVPDADNASIAALLGERGD